MVFANCFTFFTSRVYQNKSVEIDETKCLLEKDFKPIEMNLPKQEQITIEKITIGEPVFDSYVIESIYKYNKINDYKTFISKYCHYLITNNEYLLRKDCVLNILNIFRFLYKYIQINPTNKVISSLKNRYEYFYKEYKSINDESIFSSKIIKEMELIANSF